MTPKVNTAALKIDWRVKSARFTVFTDNLDVIALEDWWPEIIGGKPDNINYQPQKLDYKVVGGLGDDLFGINRFGNKIDFLFNSKEVGKDGRPAPMGTYTDAMTMLDGIIKKWVALKGLPTVKRVALGCKLVIEMKSIEEAYTLIKRHLPYLELDSKTSKDFVYQINRPRPSKTTVKNLDINRLSKWSLTENKTYAIEAASGVLKFDSVITELVCQLDLDINSMIDFKRTIPKSKIYDLFTEFLSMGNEIAERGDIL